MGAACQTFYTFILKPLDNGEMTGTQIILSLRKILQGVEYSDLNRSLLGSLSATKNHQSGLEDSGNESDTIFCPWFWNWPANSSTRPDVRNAKELKARKRWKSFFFKFLAEWLCHMAIKVFDRIYTTAMVKCTNNYYILLDDSSLNSFQTSWPKSFIR